MQQEEISSYGRTNFEASTENKMSDKELDAMIGVLCNQRMENPDVLLMDQIKSNPNHPVFNNPFQEEQYYNNKDAAQIEEEIIENLVRSTEGSMSIEEMNELKANGIYDRYIKSIDEKTGGTDIMTSMEEELKKSLESSTEETETEVRFQNLEEVTEDNIGDIKTCEPIIEDTNSENIGETDQEEVDTNEIEELVDVPVVELEVDTNEVRSKIFETYSVSDDDATQLLSVMERYRKGEKFNVYEALPNSFKREIDKAALEAEAYDPRIKNFFAKNLINDLVQDTYMSKEIQNFEEELQDITNQMNNIPGMIADTYTDEIKNNFENRLKDIAEKVRTEDPEKADRLIRISTSFTNTYTLANIINLIKERPSVVNNAYKQGRDSFNKMKSNFKDKVEDIKPRIKPIEIVYNTLMGLGYRDDYCKAFMALVYNSIVSALNDKDEDGNTNIESHIYAYYIMLAFTNLNMTTGMSTSTTLMELMSNIELVMYEIDFYMTDLWSRKSKKSKRRKK